MDRRLFLNRAALAAGGGAMGGTAGLAAPAVAQGVAGSGQPELRWRLTSSYPKSLDAIHGAGEVFARHVAEITDGRFQIRVFAAGEIAPPLQGLDAVQAGTVEMAYSTSFFYTGKNEAFAFATGLPFGMNTRQQAAWMYEGGGIDLLNEFHRQYNVYALPLGSTGAQMGGWFRREVNRPEDFQGLKMRIGGIGGQVVQKLGGVPQQLAGGDIYPALERGTIDAVEWLGPYDDEKLGFQRVARFYYYPAWWEGAAMTHLFVNLDQWNSLPASYRAAIRVASEASTQWMVARYDARNPDALRRLVSQGAQLRPFSREVMDACYRASQEIIDGIAARNADFRRIYEPWSKARDDMRLWFRVAEQSFDNYVSSVSARR
ncbi:TRAP transporter substrate-binding protein DctP [Roseomonas sp. NAR14]|uniref:TRAP transporter substrate-binding protein DctP n=1 Tax=Roseomonas acroporae TaxID=2937791 RepID=A0A9X1YBD5_9PROT|nr:TRAP transporter substrate-binding protein DctP [Roseomonas acroporae]MCK8786607.1 TRAP transporter substrate-binding protein DctP [Roseomonas acroporae]